MQNLILKKSAHLDYSRAGLELYLFRLKKAQFGLKLNSIQLNAYYKLLVIMHGYSNDA